MSVTIHVNGRSNSLVHKGSMGIAKSTLPDVCKTPSPGGPVPMPYPVIVSMSSDLKKGTKSVKVDGGNPAAVKGSEFSRCSGDEPGTAGGIKSSTNMKEATWLLYSFDVKIDGKNACRLSDKMMMNHQNTACLGGELQIPVSTQPKPLKDIAACCNQAVDCNPDNKDKGCTVRGTLKHSCCKKAIDRRKKNDKWSNVKSEEYHPPTATMPASRLDVQIRTNGKVSHVYDFKFNCSKKPTMSDRQKKKYAKRFRGAKVMMVGQQGAKKTKPYSKDCQSAKKSKDC